MEQPEQECRAEDRHRLSPGGQPPQDQLAEDPFLHHRRQQYPKKEYDPWVGARHHILQGLARLLSPQRADGRVDPQADKVGEIYHRVAYQRQRPKLLRRHPAAGRGGRQGHRPQNKQQHRQAQSIVRRVGNDPLEPLALDKGDHKAAAPHGQELTPQHQQRGAALHHQHHGKARPPDAAKAPARILSVFLQLAFPWGKRVKFRHGSSFPDKKTCRQHDS